MRDVEVLETISVRGAHGQIYKIRVPRSQEGDEQLAAMKVPFAPGSDFQREMEIAEVLSRYQHPYIVRYLGTGISQEEPFILMDLHEEGDLEDLIRTFGPLPLREALDILIQVAEAIHFLHGLGIYHRDIKAENIIVSGSGQPKVTDFGTARRYPRGGGISIPEREGRVPAREADRSRDALMLGEVLYHALSGRKLYDARLFALAHRRRLAPAAGTRVDRHLHPQTAANVDALLRRALDPSRTRPYSGVRYFLRDLRRLREAAEREQAPVPQQRPAPAHTGPVRTTFLERAEQLAWSASEGQPENAAPWIHLGNVHLVSLRAQAAERAYTQALKRNPENVIARINKAYAVALLGKWDQAMHLATAAAASAPQDMRASARTLHIANARHLVQDAVGLYAGKDPEVPVHQLYLGYAYSAMGQARRAEEAYRAALALDAHYAPAIEALAFLALQEGEPARAVTHAMRALRISEERAEAWLALGSARLAQDNPEEAVAALTRAVSLAPNHPYCRFTLARAWLSLGDYTHAEQDARHAISVDPCWTQARLLWGDTLAALGRTQEANVAYLHAISYNPECLDADGRPGLSFALSNQ